MLATLSATDVDREILERYRQRTQGSRKLHEDARNYLPAGDTRLATHYLPYPTYMVKGEGAWLTDADGNRYFDLLNNYTSLIHGHAPPDVVEDAADQLTRGTVFGAAAQPQVELAKLLIDRIPGIDLLRFSNSGSEATMMMTRAARAFKGREIIVKMDGGYHGSHDFVEVNVRADLESSPLPAVRVENRGVPDAVRQAVMVAPYNDLDAMEALLERHRQKIAAIIVEPLPATGGLIPPLPGYLRGLRDLADAYDVLLLFDEIVTFRLSRGGMQEIENVIPDMTAIAKIIGGGFPVGAFGGRRDIMEQFNADRGPEYLVHSGTFNGNVITMIAGLAAMRRLDQAAIDRLNRQGERLRAGVNRIFAATGIRGQCQGYGSLQQIHWTDEELVTMSDGRRASEDIGRLPGLLHLELLNRGVHGSSRGMYSVSTPTTDAEIDLALDAFEGALGTLKPYIAETAPRLLKR